MAEAIKKFFGLDSSADRALPKGSLLLITGASGYIASHVVNEALLAGYKVRGTARTEEKAAATAKVYNNNPDYSTVVVADFQHEGVFDEAVKGVDAVIHLASDTSFGYDPNVVVKGVVAGVRSILNSTLKSSSVKRFVLTSSSAAAGFPNHDKPVTWTKDSYNEQSVEQAWAPPPYTAERGFPVYAASKTEGEKALWEFVREKKPHFVANAVLPNFNMGRVLSSAGPTGGAAINALHGEIMQLPSQYHIDVIDNARLHLIAAALDVNLANERIFAFNTVFTWTQLIKILHELRPNAKDVATPPPNEKPDLTVVPNELGADLLRKWYGQQHGYKTIRQSVEENLEGVQ